MTAPPSLRRPSSAPKDNIEPDYPGSGDAAGDRVGLDEAKPGTLATFREIPDIGASWTIPPDTTDALEQAGFQ